MKPIVQLAVAGTETSSVNRKPNCGSGLWFILESSRQAGWAIDTSLPEDTEFLDCSGYSFR